MTKISLLTFGEALENAKKALETDIPPVMIRSCWVNKNSWQDESIDLDITQHYSIGCSSFANSLNGIYETIMTGKKSRETRYGISDTSNLLFNDWIDISEYKFKQ